MIKRFVYLLIIVVLFLSGGYYAWSRFHRTAQEDPPQFIAVKRGMFVHEILARGNVDSAQNEEVRCRVESAGRDGLVIVYVIPEGTIVKKGDLLIELESSGLDERAEQQRVTVINSQSNFDQAKADLKNAELTLKEYTSNTFIQDRKTIENEIFAAETAIKTQEDSLVHYKRLYERGHITNVLVDAAMTDYEKAKNALDIATTKLDGLTEITKEKMETQYNAAIARAAASVDAMRQIYELNKTRLAHLEQQLANCKIFAPSNGQVVYYMPRWGGEENLIREGRKVIDKDILILLPDPTQMQVKGLVNEANIRYVRKDQKATIRLEAFLNQTFEGVVTLVNPFPEPSSWQGGGTMSREYLTTVKLLNPPDSIRTGLTAEARIIVNEIPDALLLPAQSVFTHGGKTYVVTFENGKWDKLEVETGATNDKEVVILSGLEEGDEVVLGGWVHRDKLDLPEILEEPEKEGSEESEEMFNEPMLQESGSEESANENANSGINNDKENKNSSIPAA